MRIAELADQRVAIWGMGREGRAALHALRRRLPALALSIYCNDAEAIELAQVTASVITSPPDAADLSGFDVVIKSPGISDYRIELLEARRNGTRFISGTALWFAENHQARVIAVTGTKGKSTTAALIAHLLRALGHRVALAGNIGLPLLDLLDQQAEFWVVELSSFQTRSAGDVELAVITNVEEEHLDWHGSRDRYIDDKLALAGHARTLLVGARERGLDELAAHHANGHVANDRFGWNLTASSIGFIDKPVLDRATLPLPGAHNAANICLALTALEMLGEDARQAAQSLHTFAALPHRLTDLGARHGLRWIDDSISTTPQATTRALATLQDHSVILLVGGYERGLDWTRFAEEVGRRPPKAIIAMGANGPRITAVLGGAGLSCPVRQATSLADAVAAARACSTSGDTVLLSPGAPSFDQFKDYAERGQAFAELAGCTPASDQIAGLGIA